MKRNLVWAAATVLLAGPVSAQQMIINGGFESGLTGWSAYFAPGSSPAGGRYYAQGSSAVGPVSGSPSNVPHTGAGFAMSDMSGPGAGSLSQTFVLSGPATSAILSFWMDITNFGGPEFIGSGFDFTSGPNQHGRVDLLAGTPADPLTLAGGDVLFNVMTRGVFTVNWTFFSFDITAYLNAAGTYTLRLAEVDNQGHFLHAFDQVSLVIDEPGSTIPEPATMTLFGLGSLALAAVRRRQKRA